MCKNQEKLSKKFIFFEKYLINAFSAVLSLQFGIFGSRCYIIRQKQHYYNKEQDLWRELKFPGV